MTEGVLFFKFATFDVLRLGAFITHVCEHRLELLLLRVDLSWVDKYCPKVKYFMTQVIQCFIVSAMTVIWKESTVLTKSF